MTYSNAYSSQLSRQNHTEFVENIDYTAAYQQNFILLKLKLIKI